MKDKIVNGICLSLATLSTVAQTNAIFQLISIILTCVATLVVIAYNIYKWYKNATSDKIVTPEELKELADILIESADEIKNIEK